MGRNVGDQAPITSGTALAALRAWATIANPGAVRKHNPLHVQAFRATKETNEHGYQPSRLPMKLPMAQTKREPPAIRQAITARSPAEPGILY
jgi:hypothetical protein